MIIYGTRKENGGAGQILISLVADPEMVIQAVLSFNTNCHIIIMDSTFGRLPKQEFTI